MTTPAAPEATNTDGQSPAEEFDHVLDVALKVIMAAKFNFANWEQLWPTERVVSLLNTFADFFVPTRDALRDIFFIKSYELVSQASSAPSLRRLLRIAEDHPELAPGLDAIGLRRRLKRMKLLKRIKHVRDRAAAHTDTEKRPPEILFGEAQRLISDLEDIFSQILSARRKAGLLLGLSPYKDAGAVLRALKERQDSIDVAADLLNEAVPHADDPTRLCVNKVTLEHLEKALFSTNAGAIQ